MLQRDFDEQDETLGKASDEQQQQPEALELPDDLDLGDGNENEDESQTEGELVQQLAGAIIASLKKTSNFEYFFLL